MGLERRRFDSLAPTHFRRVFHYLEALSRRPSPHQEQVAPEPKVTQITADRMDKRHFISTFWGEAFLYACLHLALHQEEQERSTLPIEGRVRHVLIRSTNTQNLPHIEEIGDLIPRQNFGRGDVLQLPGTKEQTNSDTSPIWKIASRAAAVGKIFLQKSPVGQCRRDPDPKERSARATPAPAVPAASLVPVGKEEHAVARP